MHKHPDEGSADESTRKVRLPEDRAMRHQHLLPVPGLKKLKAVKVSGMELPLKETLAVRHPDAPNYGPIEQRARTNVSLVDTPDGPALERHEESNGGYWQYGHDFQVTGEWEKETEKK